MEVEESLFPEMELSNMEDVEVTETVPSKTKWTYMIDYRNRCAVLTEEGLPRKTRTYSEYLIETAMKILNTERFQYVVYGEDVGVERSEWPDWEDVEIQRDIEEALTAHVEIQQAEVLSMAREGQNMHLTIQLTGLMGSTILEEVI